MLIEYRISTKSHVAQKVTRFLVTNPPNASVRREKVTALITALETPKRMAQLETARFTQILACLVYVGSPAVWKSMPASERALYLSGGALHQKRPDALN